MSRAQDTIYALSSGAPPAGVAIVRVSGSRVPDVLQAMCSELPKPRHATLKWIRDRNGHAIDQALVLFFPVPHSFTGEDCAEFHLHGGRAVIQAAQSALSAFGLRQAEAGEFSRRAFDNGKLDLVQVEGLADLVSAETEMQRRLAVEQSNGGLSKLYQSWMQQLTRARALIEAELDFPEEEDIPGAVGERAWGMVAEIAAGIRAHLEGQKAAEIIRDGFKVVIAGRPNAGKSSLLNALVKRDAAIVTEVAGTTRDLISVDLDLHGYLVKLVDTAGLRETSDVVEAEGVRRARLSIADADLVLLLKDASDKGPDEVIYADVPIVRLRSKADLAPENYDSDVISISSLTGFGFDSLTKRIFSAVSEAATSSGHAMVARQRQVDLLRDTLSILDLCNQDAGLDIELRSEYLRQAGHLLGKLVGFVDTEDLLDVIFSEFCVGK